MWPGVQGWASQGPSEGAGPLSAGLSGLPLRPSLAAAPLPLHPCLERRPKAAQESLGRHPPPYTCSSPFFSMRILLS